MELETTSNIVMTIDKSKIRSVLLVDYMSPVVLPAV